MGAGESEARNGLHCIFYIAPLYVSYTIQSVCSSVGRVLGLEPGGRWFESSRADQIRGCKRVSLSLL